MIDAIRKIQTRRNTYQAIRRGIILRDNNRAMALDAMSALGIGDLTEAVKISIIRAGRGRADVIRRLGHELARYADEIERRAHVGDAAEAVAGGPPAARHGE